MKKLIVKIISVLTILTVSIIGNLSLAKVGPYTGFSALVIEPTTGKVIFEHNALQRRYPASLTKMMTLYIIFEDIEKGKLKPNQKVTISQRATQVGCSCLRQSNWNRVAAGTTISLETAIDALTILSANDVAVSVAELISGSEANFAKRMNQTAKRLGMKNSNFVNAHGMPNESQYTTAQDMATLGIAIYNHFPKQYPRFKKDKFMYAGNELKGHNRVNQLLAGADGIKTGYINRSGSNLVTSASRGNTRLFGVVIGGKNTKSRDKIMVDIMEDSFDALKRNRRNPSISPIITEDLLVAYDAKKNPNPKKIKFTNQRNTVDIASNDKVSTNLPTIKLISTASSSNINPQAPASIQVGAYKNRKSAQDRARIAHRKLKQGSIDIVLIDSLYRARLSGFNYENATIACHELKLSGNDCLVIAK